MAGELQYTEQQFKSTTRRLKLGIVLGIVLVAGEAVAGVSTHSLALISDAGHNAVDILAVGFSLFAVYMMVREPTQRRTFGFGRVGILTALANSLALVAVAGILVYEAVLRIIHIRPVNGSVVIIVGVVALVINSTIAITLFGHRHDLNVKSAFLHQVSDAAVSLGVVVAGGIILATHWYYADPVIAIVISVFIVRAAWTIVRDATNILLESVPMGIDLTKVQQAMEELPGVARVHHLHVWEIGSGVYALSGHVETEDTQLSLCSDIMQQINEMLRDRFKIVHPTIQMECVGQQCPISPAPAADQDAHDHDHPD